MNRSHLLYSLLFVIACSPVARAGDWMTWRSTYTHDPLTGQRVDQFAPPIEPLAPDQGNVVRSGYRHYRSTLQGSQSADNLHVVHEFGRPVMPYEHWRFPFRPYGVPYAAWGPQTPNVLSNVNVANQYGPWPQAPHGSGASGPGPHPGTGYPGAGYPGTGYPGTGYPGTGYPGGGYPGGGYPGNGYPGNGYPFPGNGFPGGASNAFPLVPPYQPAPWFDGLYPSAPPLP